MNVLLVDDNTTNRKLLRVQLQGEGISIVEACDGVEALELLAREPLDAVISDILMPRMDGYRLCHEVRKNPMLRGLRFILYSGTYKSAGDVQLSDAIGADLFIARPAQFAVILGALQPRAALPTPRSTTSTNEAILQQYSLVLVAKLEEKNADLLLALEESRQAHRQIQELNVALEDRVRERTAELVLANCELTAAFAEVKQLNGLLPICSFCKKIRDNKDYWESVEGYIMSHTNSKFSHGVCPTCYEKHYAPELGDLEIETTPATGGIRAESFNPPTAALLPAKTKI